LTTTKDFIKIELKKKLSELRQNYYIGTDSEIEAIKELLNDVQVKERLESRLKEQD
jgi:hypothetical protein